MCAVSQSKKSGRSAKPLSLSQNASVLRCPRVPPACTTAPELGRPLENALGQGKVLQVNGVCENASHFMLTREQVSILPGVESRGEHGLLTADDKATQVNL